MKSIGDRLANFDNLKEQTVKTFNETFREVPLTNYNDRDTVVIGNITANAVTRELLINNIATEHCFERRTSSEEDYIDIGDNTIDDSDPDWMYYFV